METNFGVSLLQQAAGNGSFVVSPISIALALSFVHTGSRGTTREQIRNVIATGASDDALVSYYSSISKNFLKAGEGVEFNIANRMFIYSAFTVKQSFLNEIKAKYDATAQTLDFRNSVESAEVVNGFVNEATKGKIPTLVTPDSFSFALAFLINAMYLKAEWKTKFAKEKTVKGQFFRSENNPMQVDYMNEPKCDALYYEDGNVQVLTLPYKDTAFSFNIYLPKERFGLNDFRATMTGAKLLEYLDNSSKSTVSVTIPKMKVQTGLNLSPVLKSLGLTEMFSPNADLSGIAEGLAVTEAKHKAFIETDEEGSVAAAATSIAIGRSLPSRPRLPVSFVADHPFIYSITENGHLLFIGQFYGF